MKRIILTFVFITLGFTAFSQEGVNFEHIPFSEALNKAKAENKLVFIDCYTSWCGPCKYMSESIFPQKEVGDFLNKHFICLKLDMEKGEGPQLKKEFGIRAYPTFIIMTPDRTTRHKFIGAMETQKFISTVKECFDDNKALGSLDAKFKHGERDKTFLLHYIRTLKKLGDPKVKDVVNEWLTVTTDEEKFSPDYWFIFDNSILSPEDSEAFKFVVANHKKFNNMIGTERVDDRLSRSHVQEILNAIGGTTTDTKHLDTIGHEIKSLKLSNEKELLASLAIAKAAQTQDFDQILKSCEKNFPHLGKQIRMVIFYLNRPFTDASEIQKARWEKISQVNR